VWGICSGQNLTPSKMTTCVPHLPTLRGTSELSSKVHIIPYLLQNLSALRFPLFRRQLRTKQLQQQFTPELRRDYATLFSFTFITCDATQHGQLWTVADFPAWNPYKSVPLIAIVQQINMCKSCSYEAPAPSVILPTAQSSISKPRPPTNKRI